MARPVILSSWNRTRLDYLNDFILRGVGDTYHGQKGIEIGKTRSGSSWNFCEGEPVASWPELAKQLSPVDFETLRTPVVAPRYPAKKVSGVRVSR